MVPGHLPTFGLAPRPMAPLGGEIHSREARWGVGDPPTIPYGMSSPDGPPNLGARLWSTPEVLGVDLISGKNR